MAITDAQYQAWLAADNKRRCVLVEAVYWDGAAEQTEYLSNLAYISAPADTPANTAYDDLLAEIPEFRRGATEVLSGTVTQAVGQLDIINESGDRDDWLDRGWNGRALSIYMGDPTWPKSDFREILVGISAGITAPARNRLRLALRDKEVLLDAPVQITLLTAGPNAGEPVPLCCGQCFNVEPVQTVAATLTYQVHDGPVNAITAVRDNGVAVAYTPTLAAGTFVLTAAPVGRITCDVQGAKPGGVYHTKAADIINYLVTRSVLAAGDLDASSFTAMNTTCPQTLGIYIRSRRNMREVLAEITRTIGAWREWSRLGKMQLGVLVAPTGTATVALDADDVAYGALTIKERRLPIATVRLGYARNWAVQDKASQAGAVTAANRELYGNAYQVVTATDATIKTAHPLAEEPEMEGTLFALQAEAQTEATRRLALYGQVRTTYELRGFAAPFTVSLGDEPGLTHPRYAFAAGATGIVVALREQPTRGRLTMEIWR